MGRGDPHHLLSAPGIFTLLLSSHNDGSWLLTRHPFKSSDVSASAGSPLSLPAAELAAFAPTAFPFSRSSAGTSSGADVLGETGVIGLVSETSWATTASVAGVSGCPTMRADVHAR